MVEGNHSIEQAKSYIEQAERVFVITGAGVSAESGIPTFRDAGGLWKNFDPMKVATPEAFEADPAYVWQWYDERRVQMKTVQPNPAHEAIARLESNKDHFFLLTQNVDDLHEQAGSKAIGHIHGSIWEVRCTREQTVREERNAPLSEIPPRCANCGALERPNVVWFGEMIREEVYEQAERFIQSAPVDVTLVVGTEASFPYILSWASRAKLGRGVLIDVNPSHSELSYQADIHLQGKAGEILPQLI